jgi:hypothetical protein
MPLPQVVTVLVVCVVSVGSVTPITPGKVAVVVLSLPVVSSNSALACQIVSDTTATTAIATKVCMGPEKLMRRRCRIVLGDYNR